MRRPVLLLVGLAGGVLVAGIAVGLIVPLGPEPWRTAPVVWGTCAIVVALGVGAAFLASRPSRE